MSQTIKILSDHVINKIAAGEVVERPASVVKELIENSLDAGATDILIDIEQAGKRLIRVVDDGRGMSGEDAQLAFERHATSKIVSDDDLEAVRTMGFRGEALSSIAAVARIRMLSAEAGAPSGTRIEIEGGIVQTATEEAAPRGTSLEIEHLFYNTPARLKFLKSPATEFSHIVTAASRQALAYPSIRFRLRHNKKTVLDLPASATLKERAFQIYGGELADNLIEFTGGGDARVHGLLGRPGYTRSDRTHQEFFVNHRSVRNPSLTHALYAAYGDMLMRDRHPVGFIFIDIAPGLVDVNVHPTKAEVRFRSQSQVHDLVRDSIREGLRNGGRQDAEKTTTGVFDPQRVREALSDYAETGPALGDRHSSNRSPIRFGRRKNDVGQDIPPHFNKPSMQPISDEVQRMETVRHQRPLAPLAQVHDSFIIAQSDEGMALVDQHAAHERVLFERLQDLYDMGTVPSQQLLIPQQIELGPAESSLFTEHIQDLGRLGMQVEDFGGGTFILKAVPSFIVGANYKQLLLDVLDEITVQGRSGKMDEIRDEILSVMACHPAIKVHRKLEMREMERLIDDLFQCRMPHTCPHGRPTIIRYSINDIKKMFKRM